MARRTPAAGYIARRAEAAHAQGLSYRQIAKSWNVNERTLRKLRTGQTSGKILIQKGKPAKLPGQRTRLNVVYDTGQTDAKGQPVYRSANLSVRGRLSKYDTVKVGRERRLVNTQAVRGRMSVDPLVQKALRQRIAEAESPMSTDLLDTDDDIEIEDVRLAGRKTAADVDMGFQL